VDSGGKIRTTQILRGMQGGAFEIVLASPAPADRAAYAEQLAGLCDRFVGWPEPVRGPLFNLTRLRHVLGQLPIPVATEVSAAAAHAIGQELAQRPAVALFDFVHAAVWAPADLAAPSVMFTHNVEAEIFARHAQVSTDPLRRALWRSQYRKMQRFERATLQFRSNYGIGRDNHIATIGTGVDLDFLSHAPPAAAPQVIFSGSMDWLANIDAIEFFLDAVWPKIAAAVPQARMTVVGRAPPAHLVERARARAANWTFTGYVDDIRPHIRGAAVYVIPLRVGGGTRLKVFEAMALGCPVVATAIGVEGLPLQAGTHYLLADEAEAMAESVVRLLGDAAARERLSTAARAYVAEHFSFHSIARDFERICLDTLASSQHKPRRVTA
jgi:glycosyltransferase involved in cell wall biosynthesis